MSLARLSVLRAGPQVTLQDAGRFGLMRYGVPASGPMDRFAFAIANLVLGNPANAPAIEVSLAGLTLYCAEGPVCLAIAGGDFQVSIDERPVAAWGIFTLYRGQTLVIRPGRWGNWCYLATGGKIRHDRWLESSATHSLSNFGGGRITSETDLLIDEVRPALRQPTAVLRPVSARPRPNIKVVLGPQDRFFDAETITRLLAEPFVLTDAYDRMGVRLSGPSLRPHATLDMPSEGIVRGSIQVAGDGVATVLLADHQTTGGYPKIATVLSCDLDGFVQLRSRSRVRFEAVSPEDAIAATRTRLRSRDAYFSTLQTGD